MTPDEIRSRLLVAAREVIYRETMAHRGKILETFVARHGCLPDQFEQVVWPAWGRPRAEVFQEREEVLRAFMAQHGCRPDQGVQIEQRLSDGAIRWSVRLKEVEA